MSSAHPGQGSRSRYAERYPVNRQSPDTRRRHERRRGYHRRLPLTGRCTPFPAGRSPPTQARPDTRASGVRQYRIQTAAPARGRKALLYRRCASDPTGRPCTSCNSRSRGRSASRAHSRSAECRHSPVLPRWSAPVPAAQRLRGLESALLRRFPRWQLAQMRKLHPRMPPLRHTRPAAGQTERRAEAS